MIIEILDSSGKVITKVSGVRKPEREVKDYGGDSWREWVEPDEVRIDKKRRRMAQQLRKETAKRIEAEHAGAGKHAEIIEVLSEILTGLGPGAGKWKKLKDKTEHCKNKRTWIETATEAELDNYDPATDPDWPS